jgi:hypothetical protein
MPCIRRLPQTVRADNERNRKYVSVVDFRRHALSQQKEVLREIAEAINRMGTSGSPTGVPRISGSFPRPSPIGWWGTLAPRSCLSHSRCSLRR